MRLLLSPYMTSPTPAADDAPYRRARLQHLHILPLYESGEADGALYYVMPWMAGESLRSLVARGPLPLVDALRLTTEVADALDHAHANNVVHRDIRPENVLLSGGHAIVSDYGIARAIARAGSEDTLTQLGFTACGRRWTMRSLARSHGSHRLGSRPPATSPPRSPAISTAPRCSAPRVRPPPHPTPTSPA